MSNPFHETEAPGSPSWVHELLTSGFFWITLILLLHALVATWLGGFEWRVVAWTALCAHLLSYLGAYLFSVAALEAFASGLPHKRK